MRVAVLGGGPSGLLAAWAVVDCGHEPIIFEREPKKPDGSTAGVYFLHDACNLPVRDCDVRVIVSGGTDYAARQLAYERKVYGTSNRTPVSISHAEGVMIAYDGMQAMDFCWDIVSYFIEERSIASWSNTYNGNDVAELAHEFELVVNTIPLNVLLPERTWHSELATVYRSKAPADESYMLYQANPCIPWYRASAIFGAFTLEYPGKHQISATNTPEIVPSKQGVYAYVKKVMPSPDAMPEVPDNVLLTGRYGAWDKSKLSHSAYYDVVERLTR